MEIQLKHFLRPIIIISNGDGYGYGDGDGNGYGDGDGDGNGYGDGDGDGDGDGNGYGTGNGNGYGDGDGDGDGDGNGNGTGPGYGYGYGDGILFINKQKVYVIDDMQTIITHVKNDVAKGYILNKDLTLDTCYIVRNDYHYSHGKTLKEALESLEEKTELSLPVDKRIENFKRKFKNFKNKVKTSLLYDWHFKLTGSCKMGRDNFIQSHDINLKKDKLSIYEFIELTKNSYGGEIIKKLLD